MIKIRIETLLILAAFAVQVVFAFWGPVIQQAPVPPGDDPAFHIQYTNDLLSGGNISYPPLFHALLAILHKLSGLDLPTLFVFVTPVLLIAAPFVLWITAKKLMNLRAAAFTTSIYILASPALAKSFGDGNYPNMLSSLVLFPLAVLALLKLIQKPSPIRYFVTSLLLLSLPLTHHLSLVWQGPAFLLITLFALWKARPKISSTTLWLLAAGIPPLVLGAWWILRAGGLEYGIAAGATVSPTLLAYDFREIVGTIPLLSGLAGLVVLIRKSGTAGFTLFAWTLPVFLLSVTGWFGFTERFARELAFPLAIATGGFIEYGILRNTANFRTRSIAIVLAVLFLVFAYQLPIGRGNIFTLPQGFRLLTRVDRAQVTEWNEVTRLIPETARLSTNHPNPYLPFFLDREITDDTSIATHVYLGVKPPGTPPSIYPYYGEYEIFSARLSTLPNLTLIKEFSSGARLYSVTVSSQ